MKHRLYLFTALALGILTMGAYRYSNYNFITSMPNCGVIQVDSNSVSYALAATNLFNTVPTQTQLNTASNTLNTLLYQASNTVAAAANSASNIVQGRIESASNIVATAANSASNILQGTIESVSNVVATAANSASNILQGTIESASNTVASAANSASNIVAQAAFLHTVPFFLTNQMDNPAWTTTNFNGSNTVAGLVTLGATLSALSITNNLVTTNTACVATILRPLCVTNLVVQCTTVGGVGLMTFTVDSGAVTNCLIGWSIFNPQ